MTWFRDLFGRPNSFPRDPYGWLTNQLGHVWLGYVAVCVVVWLVNIVGDSYPNQRLCFFVAMALYIGVVEIKVQGWRGSDSLVDVFFVGWGAGIWLLIDMAWVVERLTFHAAITVIALSFGVAKRMKVLANEGR